MSIILNSITRRHIVLSIIVIGLVCLTKVLELLPTQVFGNIINTLTHWNAGDARSDASLIARVLPTFALLAGLACSAFVMQVMSARLSNQVVQECIYEFSRWMSVHIFEKIYEFFTEASVGAVAKQIDRGLLTLERLLLLLLLQIIPSGAGFIIAVSFIVNHGGWWTLLVLAPLSLITIVVNRLLVLRRSPAIEALNDEEDTLAELFASLFLAGFSIKAFGAVKNVITVLHTSYYRYARKAITVSVHSALISGWSAFTSLLARGCILLLATILVSRNVNGVQIGALVSMYLYVGFFMRYQENLLQLYKDYKEMMIDFTQLHTVLQQPNFRDTPPVSTLPIAVSLDATQNTTSVVVLSPLIVAQAPTAEYAHAFVRVHEPVQIHPGQRIAIIGESGSGKSTFGKLLAGLLPGLDIQIAGHAVSTMTEAQLGEYVRYVPSKSHFIAGNFWESILFIPKPSMQDPFRKRVWQLLEAVQLGALFSEETALDAPKFMWERCSSGEQKRLVLIRALLQTAPILILDEPTEALNAELATQIWHVIFSATHDKTLICITHDTSYLPQFERILHVQDGMISMHEHDTSLTGLYD